MTKIIKNNDYIREKLEQCMDLTSKSDTSSNDLLKGEIKAALLEPLISFDLLKDLKKLWNQHFPSK